jgi:hypothetical protein
MPHVPANTSRCCPGLEQVTKEQLAAEPDVDAQALDGLGSDVIPEAVYEEDEADAGKQSHVSIPGNELVTSESGLGATATGSGLSPAHSSTAVDG